MHARQLARELTTITALLVLATTSACTQPNEDPSPDVQPAPTGEVSDGGGESSNVPSMEAGGECDPQEGDQSIPTDSPMVDGWEEIGGTPVPISATYGPYERDGELWTCYEHSPTGAVFASFYVLAAVGVVDGATEVWVEDSPARDAILSAQEDAGDEGPESGTLTPTAFRVVAYSEDSAIIDGVFEIGTADGTINMALRVPLVWTGESWMVDGEQFLRSDATEVESLDGYTRWSNNG